MNAAADTIPIEIFRAGRHVDLHGREFEITGTDLADIAARYDPGKHEAPLVIGHPETNAPAYGWVSGLRVDGDVLLADAHQVDAAFAEAVKEGRWKKRSASFLLPDAPDNPAPGQYYLNHVGFLGAKTPAVKGLRDAKFASGDQVVEFAADRRWAFRDVADLFRRFRDWLIEREGAEAANEILPDWQINALREAAQPDAEIHNTAPFATAAAFAAATNGEPAMSEQNNTADFAAREQALNERDQNLVQREQALAERERKARRDDAAEFADGLVEAGQLLPRQAATVVELLLTLPEDKPLSFASDDGTTTTVKPADALRELLSDMPRRIDYREKSNGTGAEEAAASFAAPPGQTVDANGLELHAKAIAYQREHPNTPYLAAVKAVGG